MPALLPPLSEICQAVTGSTTPVWAQKTVRGPVKDLASAGGGLVLNRDGHFPSVSTYQKCGLGKAALLSKYYTFLII